MRRTTPDGTPVPDFIPYFPERRSKRGWTPDVQRLFIGLLTATGSARASARAVERSLRSAYQLRARHGAESFAAAWTEAAARGHEVARLEALVRATESLDRPGQDDRDDRLALALIGTRDSGDAAFSEQRYRLEQAEFAVARRMLDLAEIACTPATLYQNLDQFAVWQAEAKRERRRLARADMRAIIRRAVATVPDDAAPRIRAL